MTDRPSYAFLIVAAAAAVTVFAYAGALTGPFVFDDEHNIQRNPHIRIEALSPHALYAAAFQSPIPTRPVANVSFALNFFFNGYNVVGYRLVNIVVHILSGFAVYALAAVTLGLIGRAAGRASSAVDRRGGRRAVDGPPAAHAVGRLHRPAHDEPRDPFLPPVACLLCACAPLPEPQAPGGSPGRVRRGRPAGARDEGDRGDPSAVHLPLRVVLLPGGRLRVAAAEPRLACGRRGRDGRLRPRVHAHERPRGVCHAGVCG